MEIEALLTEIETERPSGANLEHHPDFAALQRKLEGTPEDVFANRPAQPPNWQDVCAHAIALLGRSHDLRIAVALLRGLIHTEGFPGFQRGLSLLRTLVERFWETVYPQLDADDDNDPTERMNTLSALADFDAVLKPLGLATLVHAPGVGRFCLRDIRVALGKMTSTEQGEGAPQLATIQAAFSEIDVDQVKAVNASVQGSLDHLAAIEAFVGGQIGLQRVPNFSALHDLLREAGQFLTDELKRLGADEGSSLEESEASSDAADSRSSSRRSDVTAGVIDSRQEVLRALDSICEYYARKEPSSPVPLLLQRAKRLASKDFLEIIRDMAPDSLAHVQLIAGADGPPESA